MGIIMECVVCGKRRKLIDKMFCTPACKKKYYKPQSKQEYKSNRWNRKHLVNTYGNICHICKKAIERMEDVTVDHVIPLSKGGEDKLENMRPAHAKCNREKGNTYEPDEESHTSE